jgi:hypothetical protein
VRISPIRQVAGFLFNVAKNGNVTAQIFWLKTRARWKEAPAEFKRSGAVGTYDANQLSDAELERISRRGLTGTMANSMQISPSAAADLLLKRRLVRKSLTEWSRHCGF